MGGPAMDCLLNPLGAIRLAFQKACADTATCPSHFSNTDWGVQELFRKSVLDTGAVLQIPEVNSVPLAAFPANTLFRFRGMIQDMFNSEYYVGAFKDGSTWFTNKYTDVASMPIGEEAEMQVWERRPLYCVPVPGENPWVKEAFTTPMRFEAIQASTSSRHSEKRSRDVNSEPMEVEVEPDEGERKRMRAIELVTLDEQMVGVSVHDLHMPLGEQNLMPCLVKVYDGADADLKLNDIVEFIGVLSFDPINSTIAAGKERSDLGAIGPALLEDDISFQLPANKVPRLHCILHRKLSGHDLLSAMPATEETQLPGPTPVTQEIRSSLLHHLTKVLGGDALAAQYLLLHLLSQVYVRVEPMAVGKLSLNITGFEAGSDGSSSPLVKALTEIISTLLPRSHLMPLSLELLNKATISPRKNNDTNRLVTGALQLANGTHLTLDETVLRTGQLTENGMRNVQSIKNLMEWQKVEYDFEYYQIEMPADVPVLVLSSGRSRLFPADIVVPLRYEASLQPYVSDQFDFSTWRVYLMHAKSMEHTIELSMQKIIEDDLVAARQRDRSLGPEVFHRWLTLARLLSVSFGESTLSLERWNMVRDLERQRAERYSL